MALGSPFEAEYPSWMNLKDACIITGVVVGVAFVGAVVAADAYNGFQTGKTCTNFRNDAAAMARVEQGDIPKDMTRMCEYKIP